MDADVLSRACCRVANFHINLKGAASLAPRHHGQRNGGNPVHSKASWSESSLCRRCRVSESEPAPSAPADVGMQNSCGITTKSDI
eukprot:3389405-Amphidinium_carterae.2